MSDHVTLADLETLEKAIAKGVKSVKYTDKEITYRSIDEMLKARDFLRGLLGLDTPPRGSRRLAQTNKGLGC